MNNPLLIASYPRSGSTYLRMLLTGTLHTRKELFNEIQKFIPTLESSHEMLQSVLSPRFYKTHEMRPSKNVILLHRHIGDVLISEYHYHVQYYEYEKTVEEFIEQNKYGILWRTFTDYYWPCRSIRFETLIQSPESVIEDILTLMSIDDVEVRKQLENTIKICTFDKLHNNNKKFFRSGQTDQWRGLPESIQEEIISNNWKQLKMLGYKN